MSRLGTFLAARDDMSSRDQRILSFVFRAKKPPAAAPPEAR
jgi:hypothetical protein